MSRLLTIAMSLALPLVGVAAEPAQQGKDKTPRMWEHRGSVLTMAFTPEGDRLITGGAAHDHSVCIWDFKTGQVLRKIKGLAWSIPCPFRPTASAWRRQATRAL